MPVCVLDEAGAQGPMAMYRIDQHLWLMVSRTRRGLKTVLRLWRALLVALLFSPISVADTVWPGERWAHADPASQGLDLQVLQALDEEIRAGEHGNIDSMTIIRRGQVVFDRRYKWDYVEQHKGLVYPSPPPWDYFNAAAYPFHGKTDLHTLQSVSKSVMSALIGIAIARGELPGTDATLGELLPHRAFADPAVKDVRLEHVLTMTAGIDWEEEVSYFSMENDATASESMDDWVGYLLSKSLTVEPGTLFDYNSASSQALSEILVTATGVPTHQYAEQHLFGPIGIADYHWNSAPEGFTNAGGGLFLSALDLARFTLLYARQGEWDGEQIIPRDWVARSTTSSIPVYPNDPEGWGYGYQWWIYRHHTPSAPKMYGGWGWGGQFPLVIPDLDLVAVFTGWNIKEDAGYAYAFDLFYDRIALSAVR